MRSRLSARITFGLDIFPPAPPNRSRHAGLITTHSASLTGRNNLRANSFLSRLIEKSEYLHTRMTRAERGIVMFRRLSSFAGCPAFETWWGWCMLALGEMHPARLVSIYEMESDPMLAIIHCPSQSLPLTERARLFAPRRATRL